MEWAERAIPVARRPLALKPAATGRPGQHHVFRPPDPASMTANGLLSAELINLDYTCHVIKKDDNRKQSIVPTVVRHLDSFEAVVLIATSYRRPLQRGTDPYLSSAFR